MLKLKLQLFGHLMRRVDSFEKNLMMGKIEGGRRREWQRWGGCMVSLTQWTWVWVNSRSWCWTGRPGVWQSMGSQRVRHDWVTELNWTEPDYLSLLLNCNAGDLGLIPWLGGSLEKEMATHSNILAWRIPWSEETGGLYAWGCKESDMTERLTHTKLLLTITIYFNQSLTLQYPFIQSADYPSSSLSSFSVLVCL